MKTGITFSTFDLLHAGHIGMLREAKANCDYLIVGLQSDPTIDRPDTKNKPIQTMVERYAQLNALKFVDEIVPYQTEQDIIDILELFQIDVRFLGEEYREKVLQEKTFVKDEILIYTLIKEITDLVQQI